jgi:ribosomal protein S18 acetylase RimI-like enzyme
VTDAESQVADPGIVVTRAELGDAMLLHRIMLSAFDEYRGTLQPPSSALSETVADKERALIVGGAVIAWDQDEAIGFARYVRRGNHLYAGRVSVVPSHRRRGIARRLMEAIIALAPAQGCNEVQVEVRCVLTSNVGLYQSLGFEIVEEVQHPRDPAASFYVMALTVDRSA